MQRMVRDFTGLQALDACPVAPNGNTKARQEIFYYLGHVIDGCLEHAWSYVGLLMITCCTRAQFKGFDIRNLYLPS